MASLDNNGKKTTAKHLHNTLPTLQISYKTHTGTCIPEHIFSEIYGLSVDKKLLKGCWQISIYFTVCKVVIAGQYSSCWGTPDKQTAHDGCWWTSTCLAPGHQQPSCRGNCDYNLTLFMLCNIHIALHPSNNVHDEVIKRKHFPCYWPLWVESTGHRWIPLTKASDHWSPVDSLHKGQWPPVTGGFPSQKPMSRSVDVVLLTIDSTLFSITRSDVTYCTTNIMVEQ